MKIKEFFKSLPANVQIKIASSLAAYDDCHVEFYNGEYHVTSDYGISAGYPDDYKSFKFEFKSKDFYENPQWYHTAWYRHTGTAEEFDAFAKEKFAEAVTNYLN